MIFRYDIQIFRNRKLRNNSHRLEGKLIDRCIVEVASRCYCTYNCTQNRESIEQVSPGAFELITFYQSEIAIDERAIKCNLCCSICFQFIAWIVMYVARKCFLVETYKYEPFIVLFERKFEESKNPSYFVKSERSSNRSRQK